MSQDWPGSIIVQAKECIREVSPYYISICIRLKFSIVRNRNEISYIT